jgi:hypothetical protein
MPRKPKTHNLTTEQVRKLASICDKEMSSHGIANESLLAKLTEGTGLNWKPGQKDMKRQRMEGTFYAPNGFKVATIVVLHRDKYESEVREEGLGGSVAVGDWWGFTCLYLVESFAATIAGFNSSKLGRGGRYHECIDALHKYERKEG